MQLLPAVYNSQKLYTVDHCSLNQIAVVSLHFHCSFTAKVSSVYDGDFSQSLLLHKQKNGKIFPFVLWRQRKKAKDPPPLQN